jgi:hypothetical protein
MGLRLSVQEARAFGIKIPERKSKYGNEPSYRDGHHFDAQLELKRYCYLLMVERAGQLKNLIVHPKYPLFAASWELPEPGADEAHVFAIEIGVYESDFQYHDAAGELIVEDCKGMVLPLYALKKRIFRANYPHHRLMEVRQCKKRWVSTPVD